jgi:acyl-coenzyme A thioesterase PaaI-like protein
MATFSKELLSGSTRGKMIAVAATSTPGTTIHATGTSATIEDEIWLYAVNSDTTARKLTVEFGGTTTADLIEFTVPAESGLYLIVPGLVLTGTGSAATTITAFAATASVINIAGYVNRITP